MTPPPSRAKIERRGFAVILSVVVISGLALIASLSATMLFMGENREAGNRAFAVQARSAAFSCADIAMLRLKQNSGYTGNENISVDKVICDIDPVTAVGDARTVYAQATVNGLTSRIKVEVADINEFFISSWSEVQP